MLAGGGGAVKVTAQTPCLLLTPLPALCDSAEARQCAAVQKQRWRDCKDQVGCCATLCSPGSWRQLLFIISLLRPKQAAYALLSTYRIRVCT